MIRKLILSVLLITAVSVHAEVYKWTDDKGQVHYGDRPSEVNDTEEVKVDAPSSSGVALDDDSREEKRQLLLDVMQEDREEKAKQREKDRVAREDKQRRCVSLKDRLRRAEAASGMYQLDKSGNRIYLSDEGRKKSETSLRAQIKKYCG